MSTRNLSAPGRIRPGPWTQGLLTVLIAVAAVYLITNHWLHILDALPYLWVVLMLSMHLFMHGGRGGHGGHGGHGGSTQQGHGGQEDPSGGLPALDLGAVAGMSTAETLIARGLAGTDLVAASAWHFLIGGALLAGTAAAREPIQAIHWTPQFLAVLLFLSLAGTAAAFLAWFTEAARSRLDLVTAWTLLVPVIGTAASLLLAGERPHHWQQPVSSWSSGHSGSCSAGPLPPDRLRHAGPKPLTPALVGGDSELQGQLGAPAHREKEP